jgi:hypothetical protein
MEISPLKDIENLCLKTARATDLQEGSQGVEAILRAIHRLQPTSSKEVAGELGLPIPVVSAVRRELEKAGWLLRDKGMVLSDEAMRTLVPLWGECRRDACDPSEADYADDFDEADRSFLASLEDLLGGRPNADPKWDQSHATFDTTLRRADLFLELGTIQGKRALFLGDDDLTALATLLMLRHESGPKVLESCRVVVAEVDSRLVDYIEKTAKEERLPLTVVQKDLREPLGKELSGAFDFFFTDPPYTPQGADLFLDRGCEALAEKGQRKGALAIPLSPPSLQIATQKSIASKGFVIDFLDPGFNEYEGATMQGGVSALYGFTLTQSGKFKGGSHTGRLYTAQQKPHRTKKRKRN